jgi:hypothetical protein
MSKYVSVTGADVVLKFKGIDLTVPANGYYEHSAEDLATLFPNHVRKIELNEIIQEIEKRLLPPHIWEIELPKLQAIIINPPTKISLPQIKAVNLKSKEHKKIINNLIQNTIDSDLKEFLRMIEEILKEE